MGHQKLIYFPDIFSAQISPLPFMNQSFPLSIPSLKTIISYLVYASEILFHKCKYCSISKPGHKKLNFLGDLGVRNYNGETDVNLYF